MTWQLVLTSVARIRHNLRKEKRPQWELTKRVGLLAIIVLSITNSNNELSGTSTLAVNGRQGDLEDGIGAVTCGRVRVGIASDKGLEVDDSVGLVAERNGGTGNNAGKLRVVCDDIEGLVRGVEPALVAVALLASDQVVVVLELCEVLAHVVGSPRVIAGKGSNVVKV